MHRLLLQIDTTEKERVKQHIVQSFQSSERSFGFITLNVVVLIDLWHLRRLSLLLLQEILPDHLHHISTKTVILQLLLDNTNTHTYYTYIQSNSRNVYVCVRWMKNDYWIRQLEGQQLKGFCLVVRHHSSILDCKL